MRISEIMNKAVVVEDNIKIRDGAKIMSEKRIGSLIVLRKNKIVGIVTERDILKNISKLNKRVSEIMSKNIVTIGSNDSIDNAALIMGKNKIKRLPVISKDKLVGIITATNLLANSAKLNERFFFE